MGCRYESTPKEVMNMDWKKMGFLLVLLFAVSFGSSVSTWFWITHPREEKTSWKDYLSLSADQEKKFSSLESDFNLALKEMAIQDAQDKVFLCSYLRSPDVRSQEAKSAAQKMARNYGMKQEKIAMTLVAIAGILTPDQQKKFANRLMHEVCVSCKKITRNDQCLCGMCSHSS